MQNGHAVPKYKRKVKYKLIRVHIDYNLLLSKILIISIAIAFTTGTATELPNCLYACVSDTGIMNSLGNPCSREASRGVIFLGFLPFCSIRISLPSL